LTTGAVSDNILSRLEHNVFEVKGRGVMRYLASVRYGAMSNIANFYAKFPGLRMGTKVVVRTDRGVELGEVVSRAEQMPDDASTDNMSEVLRRMTADDAQKLKKIEEETVPKEYEYCANRIKELNLPMKLVDVEHLFGGNKVIFYFLADGRVDFRELVKDLAKQYQTRIEMRQIGVRDEARLLADYEHCGQPLCCKSFIKNLEPVTMKMAKSQKATLDPAKISGRCGRLMCCLRFEDKVYDELRGRLPKKGAKVVTPKGAGEVVDYDVLRQLVRVELNGKEERMMFPVAEVKVTSPQPSKADDDGE